jgi:hypothetical protein
LPTFALITEKGMPPQLQTWFDAHKGQWRRVDALKYGGPWWEVPRWTQPLFEAAGHPTSPREKAVAVTVANRLIAQPALALNRHNVAYLLRRLQDAGFRRTVAEALASRDGIDGLVDDLRAVVARGYPLVNLEYVLDSLATYPRSQFSSAVVAERVEDEQAAATPRAGARLTGPPAPATATAINSLAEVARAEDMVPYRDTADRIGSQPPLRVYLGKELLSYFVTPERVLRPQILEKLNDLRGDLFKRFGIVVPGVKFDSDPIGKLVPKAFRIELVTQTWADKDATAIEVPDPDSAVKQFVGELRRRLLAWRTWWVTADDVDKQLERNEPLKAWLLNQYALSDVKSLLRACSRRAKPSSVPTMPRASTVRCGASLPASPCGSSTGCSAASSFGRRPVSTARNWCGHCETPRRRDSRPTRHLRPHPQQRQSSRESTPSSNTIFRAPSSGLARRWPRTAAAPLRPFWRPTQVVTP